MPDGQILEEGKTTCGDEDAELRVLKWNALTAEKPVEFKENFGDIRLDANGQMFVFAFVAVDDIWQTIPRPDDSFLRQYLGLPTEQQPIGEADSGSQGPILPATSEPFETEEPAAEIPESGEPSDG